MPDETWILGLALGLAIDAGLLLGLVLSRAPVELPGDIPRLMTIGAAIVALGWTGLPVVVAGWGAFWTVLQTREAWARRNNVPVVDEPEPEDAHYPDEHGAPYRQQRAVDQHRAHWDEFWKRLMQAGDAYGFTNSILTTEGAPTRVMSDDAWKKVIPYAVYGGVLVGGKPGKPTKWAPDYDLERFEAEGLWKQLPHPTFNPPDIADGPYHATPHRHTTPAMRVIDGAARPGGE